MKKHNKCVWGRTRSQLGCPGESQKFQSTVPGVFFLPYSWTSIYVLNWSKMVVLIAKST
jgi:hypothetical protein